MSICASVPFKAAGTGEGLDAAKEVSSGVSDLRVGKLGADLA